MLQECFTGAGSIRERKGGPGAKAHKRHGSSANEMLRRELWGLRNVGTTAPSNLVRPPASRVCLLYKKTERPTNDTRKLWGPVRNVISVSNGWSGHGAPACDARPPVCTSTGRAALTLKWHPFLKTIIRVDTFTRHMKENDSYESYSFVSVKPHYNVV
jgi:hypothetical protein